MIICVAALILLVLSGITIRGTLSTASSRRAMLSGHRRIPRSIQLADLPLPCEAEAIETQAFQESPKVQSTDEMQECVSITEVTLGQWKAVEMFKVRASAAFLKVTVFVADNAELRSDDSSDRVS